MVASGFYFTPVFDCGNKTDSNQIRVGLSGAGSTMETDASQDIGVDRGIFVRGTPIWLDAQRKKSHVILTSIQDRLPVRHERLLTSISMAAMLERAGLQVSVLPGTFRQWMGFGGRQVQLVELGNSHAETGVLIDDGSRRTLVLPSLVPGIDALPPVDHVVLTARGLGHAGERLPTALLALLEGAQSSTRKIIRVETLGVGLEVVRFLESQGVSVRPIGLLGRLCPKTAGPRHAWVVAFAKEKVRGAGDEMILNTGCGGIGDPEAQAIRYYGGYQELEEIMEMTTARALTLVDLPRSQNLPKSLANRWNLTIHHPVEKSMSLDFEACGRL